MEHVRKKLSVFMRMMNLVNNNVGKVIPSSRMLLGKEPGRISEVSYLYKFIQLGYVETINDGFVMHKSTKYRIIKPFPPNYTLLILLNDLRIAKGLIPESYKSKIY